MRDQSINSRKFKPKGLAGIIVLLFMAGTLFSCGSGSSKTEEGENNNGSEHELHNAKEEHDVHEAAPKENGNEVVSWSPAEEPFTGALKLVQGDKNKLNAKITKEGGNDALDLTLNGEKAILLFDPELENFGIDLTFGQNDFKGSVAILHHYQDPSNYDALILTNSAMQMVRVENGKTTQLDKKQIELEKSNTVRFSVAGEHWKGYLNNELYNHGHAEVIAAGRVGLLLEGNGNIQLNKMSVVPLSE